MVSESVYKPFKSRISDPNNTLGLPDINPTGFKARCFRGSLLWCRLKGLGCLMWGTNPPFLRKKVVRCELLHQGRDSWPYISLLLQPVLMWPFYPLLWRRNFQVFFRGSSSIYSCRMQCAYGKKWGQDFPTLLPWTASLQHFPVDFQGVE